MNGPTFLKLLSPLWPRTIAKTIHNTVENIPTTETYDTQTYSLICNTPHTFVGHKRFSSWKRLLRTTFHILKALDLVKRRLSTMEERYQRSKDIIFRVKQNESFPGNIKYIQRTQAVKARSKSVNFNPYADQQGTLWSLSRLQKAPINFPIKNPQIVDSKHYIIRLYIQHIHEDEGHVGLVEHMRVKMQQEHRMTHLTTTLKQTIYNCFICKRQRQLASQPKMGNLPEFRFAKTPAAFEDIGIDYFGPFSEYRRNQRTSQYVCIFTCFKRAVHFEFVEELTTDSCLLAIRRFTRSNEYNT